MKIFYPPDHAEHNPPFEILDGGARGPNFEVPGRVENIISALAPYSWAEMTEPADFGWEAIAAVHDKGYLEFLQTAFKRWAEEDVNPDRIALTPATFPPGGMRRIPRSILGKAGYYMMDLSAPIGEMTHWAAVQSAYCALSGAEALVSGEQVSVALCRPPGHHAGKANCGGYCYLNNSSIAANRLSRIAKVAVLDIDYHAGNGTQEIFYERDDVLTISIHADPAEEYPYYAGYADETGRGQGEGFHVNIPLPFGTDDSRYLDSLQRAMGFVESFSPGYLVISAGLDTYKDDPLGKFMITHDGFGQIGYGLADLRLPTLFVLEGGYDLESLGENFVALIENFAAPIA
jgi:acetoin utilization deacetylase AcuC-like enzyme